MELRLEAPRPEHRQLVEAYRREFLNSGDSIDGSAGLAWCSGFDEWMALLADNSRDETARPGCVATSVFLAFDGPQLVGMVDIRHRLNDYLRRYCGHIGYSVRPALRPCPGDAHLRKAERGLGPHHAALRCGFAGRAAHGQHHHSAILDRAVIPTGAPCFSMADSRRRFFLFR